MLAARVIARAARAVVHASLRALVSASLPAPDRTGSIDVVYDPRSTERIGSALRALAADLVTERRRVLLLRRENRALKAELAALRGGSVEPDDYAFDDEEDGRMAELMGPAHVVTGTRTGI